AEGLRLAELDEVDAGTVVAGVAGRAGGGALHGRGGRWLRRRGAGGRCGRGGLCCFGGLRAAGGRQEQRKGAGEDSMEHAGSPGAGTANGQGAGDGQGLPTRTAVDGEPVWT